MEQTVNQFTKGLQMDTNPMIQGSDTLTDALNATLVTMNGNEVILQNDMGNRRVDNAFLPPGYEPVGMKEYGGVIYVASYNPVTHRSQIGSFPSPERKIDVNNPSPDQANNNIFTFSKDSNGYLLETTKLIPLTGDKVLHAGDKFMIYGQNLSSSEITNWDNVDGKKAKSPKNRKYTLSIGVLNSQNEFVDITKDLVRVDPNKKIGNDNNPNYGKILLFDENDSEIYKFNRGYFLKNNAEDNDTFTNTISDNNLILERQRLEANTYSYKLVGPLYLKVQYNIPTTFNYNIYGVKNTDNTEITIEGYFTYNCPDGVEDSLTPGNENYKTFDTGRVKENTQIGEDKSNHPIYSYNFCNFKFEPEGIPLVEGNSNKTNKYEEISIEFGNSSYDPVSNLYSVKITKHYKVYKTDEILTYDIKVGALHTLEYIKSLSIENETLDLSKLNSGEVELTAWRFFNDFENQNTTLTYSFKAYPKYGEQYRDLEFIFKGLNSYKEAVINLNNIEDEDLHEQLELYDINHDGKIDINDYNIVSNSTTNLITDLTNEELKEIIKSHLENNIEDILIRTNLINGRNTITFNWNEYGFKPRKIYMLYQYRYFSNKTYNRPYTSDVNKKYWFITTELYNNHYSIYSEEFWDNYCYDENGNFRKIELNIPINIKKNVSNTSGLQKSTPIGKMTNTESNITFGYKYDYKIYIEDNSEYFIKDINLYPDFIELKPNIYPIVNSSEIVKVGEKTTTDIITDFEESVKENLFKSNSNDQDINYKFIDDHNNTLAHSDKTIIDYITYYDRYKSEGKHITDVKNAFVNIRNVFDKLFTIEGYGYSGVYADSWARDGHLDHHFINVVAGCSISQNIRKEGFTNNSTSNPKDNSDGGNSEVVHRLDEQMGDSTRTFYVKQYQDEIFQYFNNSLDKTQLITYMFPYVGSNPDTYEKITSSVDNTVIDNSEKGVGEISRCWWRTNDGKWALLYDTVDANLMNNRNTNDSYTYTDKVANVGVYLPFQRSRQIDPNDQQQQTEDYDLYPYIKINIPSDCSFNVTNPDSWQNWLSGKCNIKINNNISLSSSYNIHVDSISADNGELKIYILKKINNVPIVISEAEIILNSGFFVLKSNNSIRSKKQKIIISINNYDDQKQYDLKIIETENNELNSKIRQFFKRDYYFCAYDNYHNNNLKLYIGDKLNCQYTTLYNIPMTIQINYKNSDSQNEYLVTTDSPNSQYVTIQVDSDNIEDKNFEDIILSNEQKFQDIISEDENSISNVIIETGEQLDKYGDELQRNYFYYKDGSELEKQIVPLFIDNYNTKYTEEGELNTLLYSKVTNGPARYKYNVVGYRSSSHHCTRLDFTGLNIIQKI